MCGFVLTTMAVNQEKE